MIRIYPYRYESQSAKALSNRLGVLVATPQQIRKHGDFATIINWGSTKENLNGEYINRPEAVAVCCDKAATYAALDAAGVPHPVFTDSDKLAHLWWTNGRTVVCRKLLRASQGRGIHLASRERERPIVQAPLYTVYVKKQDEYRVHCFRGEIIDIQLKRKRQEVKNEDVNYQIRNAHNGWVFCRGGVDAPPCVRDASIAAVSALGLDFGGVDIGYNKRDHKATVYEVNTAPGIEGTTLDKYYNSFASILPELRGGAYQRRRG